MSEKKKNLQEEQGQKVKEDTTLTIEEQDLGGRGRFLSNQDGVLRLGIEGRVEVKNASVIEADINEILTSNEFNSLILDFKDLDYISSVAFV